MYNYILARFIFFGSVIARLRIVYKYMILPLLFVRLIREFTHLLLAVLPLNWCLKLSLCMIWLRKHVYDFHKSKILSGDCTIDTNYIIRSIVSEGNNRLFDYLISSIAYVQESSFYICE